MSAPLVTNEDLAELRREFAREDDREAHRLRAARNDCTECDGRGCLACEAAAREEEPE